MSSSIHSSRVRWRSSVAAVWAGFGHRRSAPPYPPYPPARGARLPRFHRAHAQSSSSSLPGRSHHLPPEKPLCHVPAFHHPHSHVPVAPCPASSGGLSSPPCMRLDPRSGRRPGDPISRLGAACWSRLSRVRSVGSLVLRLLVSAGHRPRPQGGDAAPTPRRASVASVAIVVDLATAVRRGAKTAAVARLALPGVSVSLVAKAPRIPAVLIVQARGLPSSALRSRGRRDRDPIELATGRPGSRPASASAPLPDRDGPAWATVPVLEAGVGVAHPPPVLLLCSAGAVSLRAAGAAIRDVAPVASVRDEPGTPPTAVTVVRPEPPGVDPRDAPDRFQPHPALPGL